MADNGSQPETSAGSGNIITIISGSHIGTFNQHNHVTSASSAKIEIDYCPAPVSTFLGRFKELGTLKTLLTRHHVVALVGMGGLGKTQLSRKYVQVNKVDYKYKYWLESETPEKLENSFKELANTLDTKSVNINKVVNGVYKKIQAVSTILVFDNVEKPADVYAYLPTRVDLPPGVTIHVLVTSRWAEWACDEQIQCYKLQPFDISTSLQIFQRKFGETCIQTMQKEWKELAEMLGYLPLALQVATSYIYKRYKHNSDLPMVLTDYMKQLREGADGLLNDPLTEYGNRSVYTSMLLTLEQLENKTGDKWKFAVTLINVAAYMDPDSVLKERLLTLLDNDDNKRILDEALEILTEYSLFNQGVHRYDKKFYTVHRIIQTSIRHNQTEKGTADMYYTEVLNCVHASIHLGPYHEFQYASERESAVVSCIAFYWYPSPLITYLVQCQEITVVRAVFRQLTRNKIKSLIQHEDLLYHAVDSGDLSMAQLMYHNGADINQLCEKDQEPPLHCALMEQHNEIATWLLKNGAAPSVRDWRCRTALHVASLRANHKMASIIIKEDKTALNKTDRLGQTPLHIIDYSNNEEDVLSTFRVLVKSGADITAVDKRGNTVLHSAAHGACAAAVSLILQLNKDHIDIVNENGKTALHVIAYSLSYSWENTPDIDDERILSTIRVLVKSGVDLMKVDVRGNTVLHSAARGARDCAVSLLLQLDKDLIDIKNEDGKTALHDLGNHFNSYFQYVSEEKRKKLFERFKETARVLIMNGLSLHTRDNKGCTLLDTVNPEFKDTLRQMADECNNQIMVLPVKRQRTE